MKLLKHNGGNLLVFEVLYKLLAVAVVTPILALLLDFAVRQSGFPYLADNNVLQVLTSPLTILIMIALLILGAMYSLVEMSALIINFHDGRAGRKLGPIQMLSAGLRRARPILDPENYLMVIFLILIIPMTGFIVISGFMSTIEIPEFIMETIYKTPVFLGAFILLILSLAFLAVKWIFSIHCFVLEKKTFRESRKMSSSMVKGRFWEIAGSVVLWNLILAAAFAAVYGILIGLAALGIRILSGTAMGLAVFLSFFRVANMVMLFIAAAIGVPSNFSFISTLYYRFRGEEIPAVNMNFKRAGGGKLYRLLIRYRKRILVVVVTAALAINGVMMYEMAKTDALGTVDLLKLPEITSHRGDSVSAPENTIPAFESAIHNMADYAELDVHLTKDGVVVVMHDESLKRTTGLNKDIWQTTYDEIKHLDAGSWFGKAFKGTRVPTLDEVIKCCKGKIKLNIELKPDKHAPGLEEATLKVINDNQFMDQCVLTSLTYQSLVKVKKLEPKIKTGYILSVAYGDFYDLPYLDFFSVDASFVTNQMVEDLYLRGKEIHVWTVNKENNLEKMAKMYVDNVITDDPVKAREIIYEMGTNSVLVRMLKQIFTVN